MTPREEDLKARFDSFKDLNAIYHPLGIFNPTLYFKEFIFEEKDHAISEKRMKDAEKLNSDYESLLENSAYLEKRKKEYTPWNDILEIIMDFGMDSPEFEAEKTKRAEIKSRIPKKKKKK